MDIFGWSGTIRHIERYQRVNGELVGVITSEKVNSMTSNIMKCYWGIDCIKLNYMIAKRNGEGSN